MASFSPFWFKDFEVPPLHVPESSPSTERAQPRHLEPIIGGAPSETSSDGDVLSPHELYESSRVGSPNPEAETDARTGERIVFTHPGSAVETDARTDERILVMRQRASTGWSGERHHAWPQSTPAGPIAGEADHAQNEFVAEATSFQSSKDTDAVPRTYNAAESVPRHDVTAEEAHAQGLFPRPSIGQAQYLNVITQEPRVPTYSHPRDLPYAPPIEVCTRNLPVRRVPNSEPFEPSRPAINGHVLSTSLLPKTPEREPIAKPNEQESRQQRLEERGLKTFPDFRRQQDKRSPRNVYNPGRTESPVRMELCGSGPHLSGRSEIQRLREDPEIVIRIRDNSRARSVIAASLSGEVCDLCETCGPRRSFCNVCNIVFCDSCWESHSLHRMKRPTLGSLPHEKTDPYVEKKIRGVLNPQLEEEQRERLHYDDIDTTWFGVIREGHERPMFQDYGRYADLVAGVKELRLGSVSALSASSDHSEALYPSLVSFVGETGAGKSSLIKLIIDLKSDEDEPFETPVVGAAGRDVATSENVHLYLDPDSSESQAPLLFADCEGLNGGERDPLAAKLKRKMASSQNNFSGGRRKPTSERELVWADTAKKQSRDFAVAHLYPRLLYTFSDVIVFVVKNPRYALITFDSTSSANFARVIESVLERLVDWAAAALEKSSNQPVLPHAIIAFNASENNIPEELWDVDHATEALLESLSRTVYQNATFKKYAQFWRERDRQIESVQELVLSYYSSLRVIRIPTLGRPMLIRTQVEKLSDMIRWASKEARELKLESRMLLDADELQPYLQYAFDHFANNLHTPFDFVQASLTNSPIPHNLGGNILKLALQIMERWEDVANASTIFEELSYLVASSILLEATKQKILGRSEQIGKSLGICAPVLNVC
jgi:GTPase SAR1 family protein